MQSEFSAEHLFKHKWNVDFSPESFLTNIGSDYSFITNKDFLELFPSVMFFFHHFSYVLRNILQWFDVALNYLIFNQVWFI